MKVDRGSLRFSSSMCGLLITFSILCDSSRELSTLREGGDANSI